MNNKDNAFELAKELGEKYPNSIIGSKYIDDDKEDYIATFQQEEINGSLIFKDKSTYESFLCLVSCLFDSGLEKPVEFAKFNDMVQLIARKFPNMQATPHNLQKIAFATSLILSTTKTMQEANNTLI
jgi:hypothetical protein